MEAILLTILRAVVAFFLLLTVTRLIGRKAISQMTFFDFTVAISLGSLTANLALGSQGTSIDAGLIIITFALLAILVSLIALKSLKARKVIDSEPVTVIMKGELVKKNMQKIRMNLSMLTSLLREKKVFNIIDVEYALIENDGKISVLLKSNKQPATPSDIGVGVPYKGLTTELIIDGTLLEKNLHAAGKDVTWLKNEIKKRGITTYKDIFFAALDSSGNLYISLGIQATEMPGQYGIE